MEYYVITTVLPLIFVIIANVQGVSLDIHLEIGSKKTSTHSPVSWSTPTISEERTIDTRTTEPEGSAEDSTERQQDDSEEDSDESGSSRKTPTDSSVSRSTTDSSEECSTDTGITEPEGSNEDSTERQDDDSDEDSDESRSSRKTSTDSSTTRSTPSSKERTTDVASTTPKWSAEHSTEKRKDDSEQHSDKPGKHKIICTFLACEIKCKKNHRIGGFCVYGLKGSKCICY